MPAPTNPSQAVDPILGIDLGTTNSLVAIVENGAPRILTDADGHGLVPSVIRFDEHGHLLAVGREARDHVVEYPALTVHSVKRLMGQSRADVIDDLPHLSYEVIEGDHATARVRVGGAIYTPQELSAIILRRLVEIADANLGRPCRRAVITVPAYFDDAQRQATRDAGRIAGLDVVRIVNEPTAAALAYGLNRVRSPETIAVYDLGGGTFDISILKLVPADSNQASSPAATFLESDSARIDDTGTAFFQVLATAGDTHLGGDDVDHMIADLMENGLRAQFGAKVAVTPSLRQHLRQSAEAAKIALSTEDQTTIEIALGGGRSHRRNLVRAEFEKLIRPWVDRTLASCRRATADAGVTPSTIDKVVLVGGCTRIPLVRQVVGEFFDQTPYTALNPDEVVALGAAVQASVLTGQTRDMLLLDVLPLSLGIETMGGAVAKLILRNSTVPSRASERFTTSVDNQTSIRIHVLQGERELVRDCRSLGQFDLRGIPPMPAGIPQLEVTFHVDTNGILNVSAVEQRSGKRASVQIVPHHGLTREEVERMERESIAHAREDMTLHRIIDLRVNAALDVKWITDRLAAVGNDLAPDYRAELESLIARLRDLISRSERDVSSIDPDELQRAKEALDRTSIRLHEISIAKSLRDEGRSG